MGSANLVSSHFFVCSHVCVLLFVGQMAFTFRKKDLREELEILNKEGNEVALGFVPVDKVAGKALVVPASSSFVTRPLSSVVTIKPLAPRPEEPIIF